MDIFTKGSRPVGGGVHRGLPDFLRLVQRPWGAEVHRGVPEFP